MNRKYKSLLPVITFVVLSGLQIGVISAFPQGPGQGLARNTLTQRTIGPECSGNTVLDILGMKEGDLAGLCLLKKNWASWV